MAGANFIPLEGSLASATAYRTRLANSVVHLFKSSFVPTPSNVLADYTENEADFSGYAAITITAWNTPILGPVSGYMIVSPLVQFVVETADPMVTNTIGGMYLVDSAGVCRRTIIFDQPIPMEVVGQGLPFFLTEQFPTGG